MKGFTPPHSGVAFGGCFCMELWGWIQNPTTQQHGGVTGPNLGFVGNSIGQPLS